MLAFWLCFVRHWAFVLLVFKDMSPYGPGLGLDNKSDLDDG